MLTEPIGYGITGKWGDTIYTSRNGTYYKKRYTKPRNPRTPKQTACRTLFGQAMKAWQRLSQKEKRKWKQRALHIAKTGHNLFISYFIKAHKYRTEIARKRNKAQGEIKPFYIVFVKEKESIGVKDKEYCFSPP